MDPAFEEIAQQLRAAPASLGHTKRLMERYRAEPDFAAGISLLPEALPVRFGEQLIGAAELAEYERYDRTAQRMVAEYRRLSAPTHPRIRTWRARQLQRARWELGDYLTQGLVHAPMSFELSRGCTVKCWFCGVGAQPFGGSHPYNEQTAAEWRAMLAVMVDFFGPASSFGFLYWATDPLDNPDYEKFMIDFHAVSGYWPQTTTALALRDVARTRRLLKLSAEHGGLLERFSVLSRSLFHRILAEFSPEELLHVDLVPQFNDQAVPKALAGAARERMLRKQKTTPDAPLTFGSIACVTGFLFNLIDRTVKLISPCAASERWPLGYMIFDAFTYADAADLRDKIANSIATRMTTGVSAEMKMRFAPIWQVEYPQAGAFALRSPRWNLVFNKLVEAEDLARRVEKGTDTAGEIATARLAERQIDPVQTFLDLNLLFQKGVLCEEAQPEAEKLVPLSIRTPRSAVGAQA